MTNAAEPINTREVWLKMWDILDKYGEAESDMAGELLTAVENMIDPRRVAAIKAKTEDDKLVEAHRASRELSAQMLRSRAPLGTAVH
jgi:hypothetical protein